jgi:hypothetical protein
VTTTGSANNIITDSTLNNLDNPACPGVFSSLDPGLGSLAMNAPGRTPTMCISASSIAAGNAAATSSPLDDQRGVLRPQGDAPDIGAYEAEDPSDNHAPTTTITLDPATPNGLNGWYRAAVDVGIAITDSDCMPHQVRCEVDPEGRPSVFGDLPIRPCRIGDLIDGPHDIFAASRDQGGLTSPVARVSLKLDLTPPSLSPTLSSTPIVVGQTGVTASPNATDDTSGVAASSCRDVDTSTPGDHAVACFATDSAGNGAAATVSYTVIGYRIVGFLKPAPKPVAKLGKKVAIKIALVDAGGTRISDTTAAALAAGCQVRFSVDGVQTLHAQCMKYRAGGNEFQFDWKVAKTGTGRVTIKVEVSYPGTTATSALTQEMTIVH